MNIRSYIRKINVKSMVVIACTSMLYACDSLIYDDEGDCSVNYRVKFRYDYNMKFADAFAHEVNVVTARCQRQGGLATYRTGRIPCGR